MNRYFCVFQSSHINRSLPSLSAYLRAFLATWQVNDQSFPTNAAHRPGHKAGREKVRVKARRCEPARLQSRRGKPRVSVSRRVYLDNMPSGVTLSDPISMARAIPGASRSITSLVACNTNTPVTARASTNTRRGQMCRLCLFNPTSGVTSLGAKPVPPVVRIRLSSSSSHHSNRVSWNTQTSGGGGSVSQ